ncbi:TadE family protein [Streptomyces abyssalis]|uniref:TadE family protein n=1 Tax=Streptomyces abyssalis TaxID=933944 RepID=UPI0009A07438|nr:TadE family protein [Streptomyces abyssalis]
MRRLRWRRTAPGPVPGRTAAAGAAAEAVRPATRVVRARTARAARVRTRLRGGAGRERGASSLELAGMMPLLLLVAMAAIQLGVAGYAVQQAGTGARAAARIASQEDIAEDYAASGKAAMSEWTASRSSFDLGGGEDEVRVTTTVTIPSVVPGVDDFGDASRSATMPRD